MTRPSLILHTAAGFLLPLLLLFSIFLLLRGHNEPGGGFVAGLTAAGAFVLYAMARDVPSARKLLRADPLALVGAGLLLAAGSGLFAALLGRPFLAGVWTYSDIPLALGPKVGTPLLFDVGVYLVVLGAVLAIVFALEEE